MTISQINIANVSASPISLSVLFDRNRQLQQTLAVNETIDVSELCTVDELNRQDQIQDLIDRDIITVTVVPGTDIETAATMDLTDVIYLRAGLPVLTFCTGGGAVSVGTPATKVAKGVGFLQSKVQATLVSGTGTASVTATALRPGTNGNLISIAFVDAVAASVSVSPAPSGGEITVATTITVNYRGTTHSNTDKAQAVRDLINNDAVAKLICSAVAGGNANFVAAAATALSGGTGEGFKVYIGGIEQNLNVALTDTSMSMLPSTFTGMAAADTAELLVKSNGILSNPLTVVLAA